VHRETGYPLQFSSGAYYETGSRYEAIAFSSVLYALGKANRHPPEIEVLLRQRGLPDTAFSLPDFLWPTVEPVLQNTTSLLLSVDLTAGSNHTHSNGTLSDPHPGRSLRRFLARTPNLTHLRLNFEKHLVGNNEAFLKWLSEPVPATPTDKFIEPHPVTFARLKQLELGQLTIDADVLVAVVAKFASTLEDLSLWRMNLNSKGPPPFGHKPNLWKNLYSRLEKVQNLSLIHLKVGMLQQDHQRVYFTTDDQPEGAKPPAVKEHTGKEMDKFWKEIQEQVAVTWPEPVVVIDDDSDEDEEMADEDDEDDDEEDEDEEDE
jgi:hypothetical protein